MSSRNPLRGKSRLAALTILLLLLTALPVAHLMAQEERGSIPNLRLSSTTTTVCRKGPLLLPVTS